MSAAKVRALPKPSPAKVPSFGGKPILFGGALAEPLPPKNYLLPRFGFGAGRVSLVTARAGVGKTLALQALALAVAGDLPEAWGLPIQQHGRVLHLDYEMGADVVLRYQRLAGPLGLDLAALGERLGVVPFPGLGMTSEGFYERLRDLAEDLRLIIIDSFAAATAGKGCSENDVEVRQYIDVLSRISDVTGCTIILIHHDGKSGQTRGSTGIEDACGSRVNITAKGDTLVLSHEKASAGPKAEPVHLRIVDQGEPDPITGRSPGLAVEPVDRPCARIGAGVNVELVGNIADVLRAEGPLSANAIAKALGGRKADVLKALRAMVDGDGAVKQEDGRYVAGEPAEGVNHA